METNVERTVGRPVETGELQLHPPVEIRMLGPLSICRNDVVLELPASRKVRALLAYLALSPHAVTRSQLCELLWDVPNDPRGELRWCLSKIRRLIDEPNRIRVQSQGDAVALDLSDCFVDAIEVARAAQDIGAIPSEELRRLEALFTGEFLDGLDLDNSPTFNGWLTTQRRRFRGYHAALLEQLVRNAADGEALGHLESWLRLAPFDRRVHELLLHEFARRGSIREGDEHVAATIASFEAEGLDSAPIRDAWTSARVNPSPAVLEPVKVEIDIATVEACRASVAIMPFADLSTVTWPRGGVPDALAHDIITRLAKLRSLFIIAQGTVFALHERHVGPEEAGRILNVDYVASGSLLTQDNSITVSVELIETRTARIVWAETFNHKLDDAFEIMDDIANNIVASIASEIEASERNRAILKPPNSLDAWEAHHRGLWHMYRFTRLDNERAQHFFEMAVRLDPTFARAYAGLSFTHFQNVFQGWAERGPETDLAFDAAGKSLMVDDRDPAAHWAMGRALWLQGSHDQSVTELEQAVDLSPNFALGHYTLAFVNSQAGDPAAAISSSDHSRRLSPFDPLLFGMLGARAMALARMGRFEEAVHDAIQAAARPNAHAHILAIAAFSLALAGQLDKARGYLASIHKRQPGYCLDDFLNAMRFEAEGAALFRRAAALVGLK